MRIETLAGKEALRLFRRNPRKYFRGVAAPYLISLKDCEVSRVGRAAYFFVRHVDDLLDGDLEISANPLDYALSLRAQIESGIYSDKPEIIGLAKYAISALERKSRSGDNPRQEFLNVMDSIIFDYQRSRERRFLSFEELENYYQRAFFPVVNLMLIGLGSRFRASDIPELSFCQGRVYTVRDLEDDWRGGLLMFQKKFLFWQNLPLTQHIQKS